MHRPPLRAINLTNVSVEFCRFALYAAGIQSVNAGVESKISWLALPNSLQLAAKMLIVRAQLLTIVITVLALCACSEDRQTTPTTPTPPTGATPPASTPSVPPVRGTVVDFQTAKPMSGAVVGFAPDSNSMGITHTVITDANGQYALPEPPVRPNTSPYFLFVNNKAEGRVYLHGANNRAGDVAVNNGPCVTRYGMVLDNQTYLPIVDARILNLSNRVIATTDRDGWYQFDFGCSTAMVGFNTTWVIATHPDYNSQNFSGGRGWFGVFRDDVLLTRR